MHRTITSVAAYLRATITVTAYIAAAASFGTGLALVAEAKAAPLSVTREG